MLTSLRGNKKKLLEGSKTVGFRPHRLMVDRVLDVDNAPVRSWVRPLILKNSNKIQQPLKTIFFYHFYENTKNYKTFLSVL